MNKLGIVISTYQRPDGRTKELLTKTLTSLKKQTYKDWKLFLIGDKYEDNIEFENLCKLIPEDKIISVNLPIAIERERYKDDTDNWNLWHSGGAFATSFGTELAVNMGYDYICQLDHDDIYREDHLETINKGLIDNDYPLCIYTKSTYTTPDKVLPQIESNELYINKTPQGGNMVRSSVCVNHKQIRFGFVDPLFWFNVRQPGDLVFFNRLQKYLNEMGGKSILINKITIDHLEEGYVRNIKKI